MRTLAKQLRDSQVGKRPVLFAFYLGVLVFVGGVATVAITHDSKLNFIWFTGAIIAMGTVMKKFKL